MRFHNSYPKILDLTDNILIRYLASSYSEGAYNKFENKFGFLILTTNKWYVLKTIQEINIKLYTKLYHSA